MKDNQKKQFILSMVMLCALYFVFGLVSWVNSILVPYFKVSLELKSEVQGYLAQFAFYIAYLVMTIPASAFLSKVGYKKGAMIGLWILALGAVLFTPAALSKNYTMFLVALFTMGTALAVLQTVANPFVTIIGPLDAAAKRISTCGICNKFAGILAPIVFSALVIKPHEGSFNALKGGLLDGAAKDAAVEELLGSVIAPYLVLAVLLVIFGVVFYKSSIKDINPAKDQKSETVSEGRKSVLSYPYLVLGVLALFAHLGTQALSINTIIPFAESIGFKSTAFFPSLTLAATLLGYFCGVLLIPRVLSQQTVLKICTTLGLIFSVLVIALPAKYGIWCLVLMGIPNSVIYAGIWPLAIHDLGKWTNLGSAILVMALCGSAIFPLIKAAIVDSGVCLQMSYWILIPSFLYMVYYAFSGHKINSWTKKAAK